MFFLPIQSVYGKSKEAKVNVGKSKRMSWHCTTSASCNHHPFAKCQDRENRGSWLKSSLAQCPALPTFFWGGCPY